MKNPIHFFHANGFPAETYKELLSLIDGDIQDPLSVIGKQIPEVKGGITNLPMKSLNMLQRLMEKVLLLVIHLEGPFLYLLKQENPDSLKTSFFLILQFSVMPRESSSVS